MYSKFFPVIANNQVTWNFKTITLKTIIELETSRLSRDDVDWFSTPSDYMKNQKKHHNICAINICSPSL